MLFLRVMLCIFVIVTVISVSVASNLTWGLAAGNFMIAILILLLVILQYLDEILKALRNK